MREIPLTQGYVTIVDDEDYDFLMQWKWYAVKDEGGKRMYARRAAPGLKTVRMHSAILGTPTGIRVDHINHDGLDNRRANLRRATNTQNVYNQRCRKQNITGFKGVIVNRGRGKAFIAGIRVNGKQIHLGLFEDAREAAIAYNRAAVKHFGEFAYLNPVEVNV
jgi:hypothetical protein